MAQPLTDAVLHQSRNTSVLIDTAWAAARRGEVYVVGWCK